MTDHRIALRALVDQYARAVDARDPSLLMAVFTADAVLVTPTGELRGRSTIGTIPERLGRYLRTDHQVHEQEIGLSSEDEASGTTTCTARHVYASDGGERVYVMHICYHDRFRRGPDGWQITERRLELLEHEDRALTEDAAG
jgi:uncharacterized protein (TIGR02246 family)